jgi:hypothetical protein
MIYLIPEFENVVVVTLTEKTTINAPIYLFRFVSAETNKEYLCISADLSTYKQRYNKFILETIETTPNPLLGQLQLTLDGQYEYYIYAQHSTTNLDYKLSTELVEQGIMIYDKQPTERKIFENGNQERKVFGE